MSSTHTIMFNHFRAHISLSYHNESCCIITKRESNVKKFSHNARVIKMSYDDADDDDDFFCANILENQAQWRDKTKGLSKLIIVKQCVSRQWMDEDARKLRRIGSIKEICFRRRRNETISPSDLTLAGSELYTVGAATETVRIPAFVFTREM